MSSQNEPITEENKNEGVTTILIVDKYGINLYANNYTVGRKNINYDPMNKSSVKFYDITYHPTLHHALEQLSKRLLEDNLKISCKENHLDLKGLINIINKHHDYFKDLTKGF